MSTLPTWLLVICTEHCPDELVTHESTPFTNTAPAALFRRLKLTLANFTGHSPLECSTSVQLDALTSSNVCKVTVRVCGLPTWLIARSGLITIRAATACTSSSPQFSAKAG